MQRVLQTSSYQSAVTFTFERAIENKGLMTLLINCLRGKRENTSQVDSIVSGWELNQSNFQNKQWGSEDQIIYGQKIKKDEWEWKKNWIVHISERTQTFFFPQYFLLTWNTRVPSDIKYPVVMGRFKNITCVCGFCRSLLISPIFRVYRIRNDCQRSNVRRTLILDKTVKNSRHFKLHLLRWMINLKKLRLLLNQQNERELWLIANFKLYLRKFRLWIILPNGWQNHKILSCLWPQRKKEGKNSYLSMSAFWLAQTLTLSVSSASGM